MKRQIVIEAKHLGKCYQVYKKPIDRLKQSLWRGRRKFFTEFWALHDVSFQIHKNETLGIIGSNGSGKSTLLRLICGILEPTQGAMDVRGRISALLELGTGFNPEFTGRENVYMNAAIMGLRKKETDARFPEIEAFADIGAFMDQPVKTYSSGMYVKLAFSVAVHVSPEIMLIDEALSVGDIRFQQKCMARIKSFCETGTVVFVSHNMSAVTELCSRVIWVEQGRIRMDGSPKEVVTRYRRYMNEGEQPAGSSRLPVPSISESRAPTDLKGFRDIPEGSDAFGDFRVTIEKIRMRAGNRTDSVAYAGEPFEIGLLLQANDTIRNPIAGYIVKDRLGRDVLGDNTMLMKHSLEPLMEGRQYLLFFKFKAWPNLLAGNYTLSLAVSDGIRNKPAPCHFFQDIAVIESVSLRPPAGIFSVIDLAVDVERLTA